MSRCRFGLFDFDVRSGDLRREGEIVKLSPQPARVLALLLARPGEVILREEFEREIWGSDTFVDFERGLNFCILQVRAALGDSSDNPRFVQTVPRRGYRFIAPVATSVPPVDLRPSPEPPSPTLAVGDGGRGEGRRSGPTAAGRSGSLGSSRWPSSRRSRGWHSPTAPSRQPQRSMLRLVASASRCCPSSTSRAIPRPTTSRTDLPTSSSHSSAR